MDFFQQIFGKLFDLLPYVREGTQLLRIAFFVWTVATFGFVGAGIWDYFNRAAKALPFSLTYPTEGLIERRKIELRGKGLSPDLEIKASVSRLKDADVIDVPQPAAQIQRAEDGNWVYQWIAFDSVGKHEIRVQVQKKGQIQKILDPINVAVIFPGALNLSIEGLSIEDANQTLSRLRPPEKKPPEQVSDVATSADLGGLVRIKDMGNEGAVAGLVVASATEILLTQLGRTAPRSGRYLYSRAQKEDGLAATDGVDLRTVIKVAEDIGVPPESVWPYKAGQNALPAGQTWESLDQLTRRNGVKASFESLTEISQIKLKLAQGHPVVAGFRVYQNVYDYKNGTLAEPKGPLMGLGAVLVVGYDKEEKVYRFANFWGTGWGEGGFGKVAESVIDKYASLENLWSAEKIK